MYRDKTLIPTEAIRLCALGMLAGGPCKYGDLASGVRNFSSHIVGPSLDILGPSIELLRYEGLAEAVAGAEAVAVAAEPEDTVLTITASGRAELLELLRSNVRMPIDDINKLVVALKFRFLHYLDAGERRDQIDGLIQLCLNEHDRLSELRDQPTDEGAGLSAWLAHDIGQIDARIAWLEEYRNNL